MPLAFADLTVADRIAADNAKIAKVDETVGLGLSSTSAVQLPAASSSDGIALGLAAASVVGCVLCVRFISISHFYIGSSEQNLIRRKTLQVVDSARLIQSLVFRCSSILGWQDDKGEKTYNKANKGVRTIGLDVHCLSVSLLETARAGQIDPGTTVTACQVVAELAPSFV